MPDNLKTGANADSKEATRINLAESGRSGTQVFAGIIEDEYLTELRSGKKYAIYDKMRKSDPVISAVLAAVKMPLLSAIWEIVPASRNEEDLKIAEFVRKNLFENISFNQVLNDQLTFLDFGFSVLEPVYILDKEGTLHLYKIASRKQETIREWKTDNKINELQSVVQDVYDGKGPSFMSARKLLITTYLSSGMNLEGTALLRSMYKPWYYKFNSEKLIAVGIERSEIGIPEAILDANYSFDADVLDTIDTMLSDLVNHENSYIRHDSRIQLKFLETAKSNLSSLLDFLKYQDQQIVLSGLTQFLVSGMWGSSGISSAESFINLFLLALQAIANLITSSFNKRDLRIRNHFPVIETLVRYNFGDKPKLPKLEATKINAADPKVFASMLKDLVVGNVIEADDELERHARTILNFPEKDKSTRRKIQYGKDMTQSSQQGASSVENKEK